MDRRTARRRALFSRIAGLVLATIALSGCVVVTPYHYRPYGTYYR